MMDFLKIVTILTIPLTGCKTFEDLSASKTIEQIDTCEMATETFEIFSYDHQEDYRHELRYPDRTVAVTLRDEEGQPVDQRRDSQTVYLVNSSGQNIYKWSGEAIQSLSDSSLGECSGRDIIPSEHCDNDTFLAYFHLHELESGDSGDNPEAIELEFMLCLQPSGAVDKFVLAQMGNDSFRRPIRPVIDTEAKGFSKAIFGDPSELSGKFSEDTRDSAYLTYVLGVENVDGTEKIVLKGSGWQGYLFETLRGSRLEFGQVFSDSLCSGSEVYQKRAVNFDESEVTLHICEVGVSFKASTGQIIGAEIKERDGEEVRSFFGEPGLVEHERSGGEYRTFDDNNPGNFAHFVNRHHFSSEFFDIHYNGTVYGCMGIEAAGDRADPEEGGVPRTVWASRGMSELCAKKAPGKAMEYVDAESHQAQITLSSRIASISLPNNTMHLYLKRYHYPQWEETLTAVCFDYEGELADLIGSSASDIWQVLSANDEAKRAFLEESYFTDVVTGLHPIAHYKTYDVPYMKSVGGRSILYPCTVF